MESLTKNSVHTMVRSHTPTAMTATTTTCTCARVQPSQFTEQAPLTCDYKLAASGCSLLTSSLQPPVQGGTAISKHSLHLAHWAINNLSKSDHMQHNWTHYITHGGKKRNAGMDGGTDKNREDNRGMTSGWSCLLHRWQSQACRV